MRTWTINLLVSAFALIATPLVFFVLSGGFDGPGAGFSGSQTQYGTPAPRFSDPFAGIPQGYRPQFGFPPPNQRPVLTADIQRQRCLTQMAARSEIESDYREPFCECAAERSFYTSGAAGNRIALACREKVLADLAKRPDLSTAFDAKFAGLCDEHYLDRDDRIEGAKVQEMCGCVATSIKQSPLRVAAIAFAGAENDGNRLLNSNIDACTLQTRAFFGEGWKIDQHNGVNVAVLRTPGHYDIASLMLSCTSDNQMRLEATYRPRGHRTNEIKRDASSYTNGWQIHLTNGIATGKEVADFYQLVSDDQEKSGAGTSATTEFEEVMPDGRGGEYETIFGDVKKVVAPLVEACAPKPGGNFTPPPVAAGASLPDVSSDNWVYAGRTAAFGLDSPPDGVAPLTMLQFSCEGEPFLELAGGFTDDTKTRDRLTISLGGGAALAIKMLCDYGEGGIECVAPFKGDQLSRLAGARSIGLLVGGKVLATVPFGSSEGIRKTFPYCKTKPISTKPPLPPSQPGVSRPRIRVDGSYTLVNAMNLRATAAADGRILRSLPKGASLVVVRQVRNARGEAWSAVAMSGKEIG